MIKIATGKFAVVSEVSKWDITVDQDSIEEGTALTTTWTPMDGGDPEISSVRAGQYMLEDGRNILVDADGVVRMIFKQEKKNKMSKLKELKQLFKQLFDFEEHLLAEATLDNGSIIMWEGDLVEGTAVFRKPETEGDDPLALEDGDYTLEDGTTFSIAGGLVTVVVAVAPDDEFNAAVFEKKIMDAMEAKLKEFTESFSLEDLFAAELKKQDINTKFTKLRTDVSTIVDKMMDAMTEFSKKGPTQPNRKQPTDEAQRAVSMVQRLKEDKLNNNK